MDEYTEQWVGSPARQLTVGGAVLLVLLAYPTGISCTMNGIFWGCRAVSVSHMLSLPRALFLALSLSGALFLALSFWLHSPKVNQCRAWVRAWVTPLITHLAMTLLMAILLLK